MKNMTVSASTALSRFLAFRMKFTVICIYYKSDYSACATLVSFVVSGRERLGTRLVQTKRIVASGTWHLRGVRDCHENLVTNLLIPSFDYKQ